MTITHDLMDRLGIELPILLAPMAGPGTVELAIAVSEAGGLGGLPCAMSGPEQVKRDLAVIRQRTSRPINVNFFCHTPPAADEGAEQRWKARLEGYYRELGLDPGAPNTVPERRPFSDEMCTIIEEARPRVVSFHFGLPAPALVARVKAAGALVLSSATTAEEARWLEHNGCDAIIAQGYEAGGHRGMFLTGDIATQAGTLALVPQVVDAVSVPVIAAGGISDARGIAAAFALGAAAVQAGSAYLHCPEAKVHPGHRAALAAATENATVLTNVFSGRPSRGIVNRFVREVGPIAAEAPPFPLAANAGGPLRAAAEAAGSTDFSPLWAGQAAGLGRALPAGEVTRRLAAEAQERLKGLGGAAWGAGS
jgi:nitronate monooxygenase